MGHILELNSEEQVVRDYLERALDGSSPSAVSLRLVQRFATETPELFCNAALSLLESVADSAAQRFMIVKLLSQPRLLAVLSDPARFEKAVATRLFRLLMNHDRSLDVRLAQCLPDRYGSSEMRLQVASCERALEVLDEVSVGRRIVPILGHLVDHPKLSAKAALVVGKRVQSVNWAKRLLTKDRNPRDRANALEALWGLDSNDARSLLWEHSGDENNRVAGNAVFGLHVVGEPKAAPTVNRMAHRIEPEFRWTSAWLMAKIGREEHVAELKQMIKDENPGVRRAALKALVGIRQEQIRKLEEEARTQPAAEQTEAQQAEIAALAKAACEPLQWLALAPEAELIEPPKPEPETDPESEDASLPDFNLRLDGRSFSFQEK